MFPAPLVPALSVNASAEKTRGGMPEGARVRSGICGGSPKVMLRAAVTSTELLGNVRLGLSGPRHLGFLMLKPPEPDLLTGPLIMPESPPMSVRLFPLL